ncbi:peptidylprolyl isomerase [Sphingomonas sp. Mn802worker]|uniref:peptidylprolyl isomerase n=1 Tax=Sphingomonas sp. Mn802worker TaxID=629773 RepID=UPI00037F7A42|nr:peptidylprolyl isomerase [Sphingomonas sp. Mn802worker]
MLLPALLALFGAASVDAPPPSPGQIAAAAPAVEWIPILSDELLVMTLAPAAGQKVVRRVVIQLIPSPLSAGWVANIRQLVAAHWWDGTSVNRVQDNYVAQWGDATEKKPLPPGLRTMTSIDYPTPWRSLASDTNGLAKPIARWAAGGQSPDVYAPAILWYRGFPLASDAKRVSEGRRVWPVHCYGSVGVGRNLAPDTGSGAELYAVIGHAPRHLDRNIAVVGRVIAGMEFLSSLPRGTGDLGFYEQPSERLAITSVRLASELPAAERPHYAYLSTTGATWPRYVAARRNREPPFFEQPAGAADVCNIPVPIRTERAEK